MLCKISLSLLYLEPKATSFPQPTPYFFIPFISRAVEDIIEVIKNMRDRMERLVVLPFSAGCISQANVDVVAPTPTAKRSSKPVPSRITLENDDQESFCETTSTKNPPKPNNNISTGFHRLLIKTLKNISQLFEYKDETDEEEDAEIEIGFPTDVKHVTHIGIDGCATMIGRWDSLIAQGQDPLIS